MTRRGGSRPLPLLELEAAFEDAFRDAGVELEAARLASLALLTVLCTFRGQQVYVSHKLLRLFRDRQIYRDARGSNTLQLARDHNLNERTVRKIVRRCRLAKGML